MSIRVGDSIVRMRALGPDVCRVLPPPIVPTVAPVAGGALSGTIYTVDTWLTPWGETEPGPEQPLALTGGNGSFSSSSVIPAGAVKKRTYWGQQASGEQQYQELDLLAAGLNPGDSAVITVSGYSAAVPNMPPQNSSAWLPDSDGGYVSAATAFMWLNQALRQMVTDLGGINDITGIAWPSQAAWQYMTNRWLELQNLWWDGWWQVVGNQSYTWLKSPIQAVPGYFTSWSNAGRDMIGLWPQPGSGPAGTVLSADLNASAVTIPVAATAAFTMPGLIQIEDELILVSAPDPTGLQFVGCLRGAGGSVAGPHPSGAAVTQLIALITGKRLPPEFMPGNAYTLLQLPAGWDVPLDLYLLAKFREKEQEHQVAQTLMQEFRGQIEALRSSRDAVPKNRQIGDSRVYEAFAGYRAFYPFGILVP